MSQNTNLKAYDAYHKKRMKFVYKGIAAGIITAITVVIYGITNAMAQEAVSAEIEVIGFNTAVMVLALLGVCEGAAGIMLIIYTLITGNTLKDYKRLWNFKASRLVLLCGFTGGAIATTCLVGAVPLCGATITYAIFALIPIVATIGGRIFLKEKFALRMVIGIVIAVAGVLVAVWAPPEALPHFYIGIAIAFVCPIAFAIEAMLVAHAADCSDPVQCCGLYRCIGGAVFEELLAVLICLATGQLELYGNILKIAFTNTTVLGLLLITGLIMAIEYATVYVAYSYLGAARGAAILNTNPIWSIPVGFAFAGLGLFPYSVTTMGIVGAFVVVVGVMLIIAKPAELLDLRDI
jgi:drug/metabolite transporter (DMT)-like permease